MVMLQHINGAFSESFDEEAGATLEFNFEKETQKNRETFVCKRCRAYFEENCDSTSKQYLCNRIYIKRWVYDRRRCKIDR